MHSQTISLNDDLVSVSRSLTPFEEKFAGLCANGRSQSEAYRQSCPKPGKNADVIASGIANRPHVKARIAELRDEISKANVLDARERREILATLARTPVTAFMETDFSDPKSVAKLGKQVLALKKIKTRTDPSGNTSHEIETVDRIAAIREDSILAGDRRPDGSVQVGIALDAGALAAAISQLPHCTVHPLRQADVVDSGPKMPAGDSLSALAGPYGPPPPLHPSPDGYGPPDSNVPHSIPPRTGEQSLDEE
jgi:hypothetical protein